MDFLIPKLSNTGFTHSWLPCSVRPVLRSLLNIKATWQRRAACFPYANPHMPCSPLTGGSLTRAGLFPARSRSLSLQDSAGAMQSLELWADPHRPTLLPALHKHPSRHQPKHQSPVCCTWTTAPSSSIVFLLANTTQSTVRSPKPL